MPALPSMMNEVCKSAVVNEADDHRWIQLNVGLARRDGVALPAARALLDEVAELVDDWRTSGTLEWFFFMRKPPDVRLRFYVAANVDVRTTLDALVTRLAEQAHITTAFYSAYAPETARFGGPAGMRSVHRYFDADTRGWLCLDALERRHGRRVSPDALLPALAQDLFLRGAQGRQEAMATSWRSLANEVGASAAKPGLLPDEPHGALQGLAAFVPDDEERACLAGYETANRALACELIEFARDGQLVRPVPEVLASVMLFSFHRHGFAGERSAPLVAAMLAAQGIVTAR